MKCLKCGIDYIGDIRSHYCSKVCRKRAENDRMKLKRLFKDYARTNIKMEESKADGDYLRANRARSRLARIVQQLNELEPVSTQEQKWVTIFYEAIGVIDEKIKRNLPKSLP